MLGKERGRGEKTGSPWGSGDTKNGDLPRFRGVPEGKRVSMERPGPSGPQVGRPGSEIGKVVPGIPA